MGERGGRSVGQRISQRLSVSAVTDVAMAAKSPYNESYYARHGLGGDRIALWFYARLVRRLRPQGGRLLDFGCGTGHLLRRLSDHFEAYGYDASAEARGGCRLTAPDAVVLEEWESLPAGQLRRDRLAAHARASAAAAPGHRTAGRSASCRAALLLFVVPNPGGLGHRLKGQRLVRLPRPDPLSACLSRGEWLTLARRVGLEVRWVRGDGMWDAPYVPLLPVGLQRALFGAPAGVQIAAAAAAPVPARQRSGSA